MWLIAQALSEKPTSDIVLKFLDVLIKWPTVIFLVLIIYYKPLSLLLRAVSGFIIRLRQIEFWKIKATTQIEESTNTANSYESELDDLDSKIRKDVIKSLSKDIQNLPK